MIEYGGAPDATAASMWLCERMRIEPAALGWKQDHSRGGSNGHTHTNGTMPPAWPDPVDLPQSLLPVAPFDYAMLPQNVRAWVEDVSERMQCPPDYVAVTVMAALASLIGRKVTVRPKKEDNWSVVVNLWALLIGPPGIMKSPAQNEGLRFLKSLATAAREAFNLEKAKYEIDVTSAKARGKHAEKEAAKLLGAKQKKPTEEINKLLTDLLKPEKIDEPTLKRYITSNATYQALAALMQENTNGLLVDRDEMLSLVDHLDEEGHADERGFYLTGWNGDSPYTCDRIGRGFDLHVEAVCLSMIGGTQPARISQYLAHVRSGGRGNDGLIQRFGLMVWPDIPPTWTNVDRQPNPEARDAASKAFKALDTLDWHDIGAMRDRHKGDEVGVPYLRLSDQAHDRFVTWRTELEQRLRQGTMEAMLESHLAKYRKLIPGLALIIHLTDGGKGAVSESAVEKALQWAKYLETHAARTYASMTIASADAARAIIAKIKSGHLKSEFGSREIIRAQWSMLRDRETIHGALRLLVDHDWLGKSKRETPGRTATVYTVNPKALNFGSRKAA
jgi:putative DNA primase/helicase